MLFWGLTQTPEHQAPERFWPITPIPLQAVSELNDPTAPGMAPSPLPPRSLPESLWEPAASESPGNTAFPATFGK